MTVQNTTFVTNCYLLHDIRRFNYIALLSSRIKYFTDETNHRHHQQQQQHNLGHVISRRCTTEYCRCRSSLTELRRYLDTHPGLTLDTPPECCKNGRGLKFLKRQYIQHPVCHEIQTAFHQCHRQSLHSFNPRLKLNFSVLSPRYRTLGQCKVFFCLFSKSAALCLRPRSHRRFQSLCDRLLQWLRQLRRIRRSLDHGSAATLSTFS